MPVHHSHSPGDHGQAQSPESTDAVKVLHLINGEHYSGAERVQDLLALRLGEFGYQAGFACVKAGKFPAARQSQDAPLHRLGMWSKFDLRAVWKLASLLTRDGYKLLHCHTPRTAMIGRLAAPLAGTPMIYHVHSPTSRDSTRIVQNWLNVKTEQLSLTGVARLITVSHSLCQHMQTEGYSQDLISVVPNGVPCLEQVADRETPAGEWTLGAVALFRPRKGVEMLIDAIGILRKQGKNVRLRAVGPFETPEYEKELKQRVVSREVEPFVEWTGFAQNVNAELAQMDMFVLPSLYGEGLPMVVLEAMAAGVPVVGTRVEGVPEAIRDGVDGVLAEPSDAEDLARVIATVIDGKLDWQLLRKSALHRQAEHFSDRSMAAGVASAYDVVLNRTLQLAGDVLA